MTLLFELILFILKFFPFDEKNFFKENFELPSLEKKNFFSFKKDRVNFTIHSIIKKERKNFLIQGERDNRKSLEIKLY